MTASSSLRLPATIKRRFIDISIGQVHAYTVGEEHTDRIPVCVLHASPWSARWLAPFIEVLGKDRWVVAPDTPGQGDSCLPDTDEPDCSYFATALASTLDALNLDCVDLVAFHTGAHIAAELAIDSPKRVRRLVLDGLGLPPRAFRDDYIAELRKTPQPDVYGTQFNWAFQVNRDLFQYFPYFRRDARHRRADRDLPSAGELHARALDILKNIDSYHLANIAAWRHNVGGERYSEITTPTMLTSAVPDAGEGDINDIATLIPRSVVRTLPAGGQPGDLKPMADLVREFLDAGELTF